MKTLKQFMPEEVSPFALTGKGIIDVQDEEVRDNINALLNGVTMKNSATPYTALEHVKKVLANFHIFLPRTKFLEGDSGYDVWNISQFGDKVGMDDDGQFKSSTQSPYFLYFEWQMSDSGTFKIFTEIVNQEELDDLISDVEDEFDESDDMEEISEGKDYEGDMAKTQLNAIADMAKKMSSKMKDDDQLEAWVQSKITKAKDYISAAHDSLMYDDTKDVDMEEINEVSTELASKVQKKVWDKLSKALADKSRRPGQGVKGSAWDADRFTKAEVDRKKNKAKAEKDIPNLERKMGYANRAWKRASQREQ